MEYVDQIYEYKGLWDVDSRCGLKIVKRPDKTIVIATELYQDNPGTSVASFNDRLATMIIGEFEIDPDKLVFIEYSPKKTSSTEHYRETFDVVTFAWDGSSFSDPDWQRVTREEVDAMIAGT